MASPFTTYKLIILYMLQNSDGDLTNSQITDFILDRKYTNYFQLQQAVSELVERGGRNDGDMHLRTIKVECELVSRGSVAEVGQVTTRKVAGTANAGSRVLRGRAPP